MMTPPSLQNVAAVVMAVYIGYVVWLHYRLGGCVYFKELSWTTSKDGLSS